MNVKLLRKVKRHILAEPKRLYMFTWVRRKTKETPRICGRTFARCNTAACIAGWTALLSKVELPAAGDEFFALGQRLLGLDRSQASALFAPACWPEQFQEGNAGNGTRKTALIAAARIEHFIKTKGRG